MEKSAIITLEAEQTRVDWKKIFQTRDVFVREHHGIDLFDYQKELSNKIIISVFLNKGETIVAEVSRQSGKTCIIVWTMEFLLCFYFAICREFSLPHYRFFNIGIFAPQFEQARTDFVMLKDALRMREKEYAFSISEFSYHTVNIFKGSDRLMVYCMTASPTSHQESKTLNLIIFEESQDLDDRQVDKAIIPMGAATHATMVFIGVAGYRRCRFHDLILKLPPEQKFILDCTFVEKKWTERFKQTNNILFLNYGKHILDRRLRLGETSDEFKTQYLLEWVLERGQFITYEELLKLQKSYAIADIYGKTVPTYGGIDWGKMNDSTVLTVLSDAGEIVFWREWLGDDYNTQIEEIAEVIRSRFVGMRLLHCDATATQDMAVDVLRAKLSSLRLQTEVRGVNFGVEKDQMFKSLSSLMKDTLLEGKLVRKAFIKFPEAFSKEKERFFSQFLDLQKEIRNERWVCRHPEGPQYHDDYCCSLALAALALKREIGQEQTGGFWIA